MSSRAKRKRLARPSERLVPGLRRETLYAAGAIAPTLANRAQVIVGDVSRWDGGARADPIADLQAVINASIPRGPLPLVISVEQATRLGEIEARHREWLATDPRGQAILEARIRTAEPMEQHRSARDRALREILFGYMPPEQITAAEFRHRYMSEVR